MKPIHIFIGAIMLVSSTANAAILSVTQLGGDSTAGTAAAIIAAPADTLAINTGMQGFNEAQDVFTSMAYTTDGGFFNDSGIIPAGSHVDSHMIYMNSVGNTELIHNMVKWTFKNEIIGIMSDVNGLLELASTPELGAAGTIYPAVSIQSRGFERDPYTLGGPDKLEWSILDPFSIIVSSRVTTPGDWIRVVTAAVPVPAAIWLFGTALIGFIGFSRRRIVA